MKQYEILSGIIVVVLIFAIVVGCNKKQCEINTSNANNIESLTDTFKSSATVDSIVTENENIADEKVNKAKIKPDEFRYCKVSVKCSGMCSTISKCELKPYDGTSTLACGCNECNMVVRGYNVDAKNAPITGCDMTALIDIFYKRASAYHNVTDENIHIDEIEHIFENEVEMIYFDYRVSKEESNETLLFVVKFNIESVKNFDNGQIYYTSAKEAFTLRCVQTCEQTSNHGCTACRPVYYPNLGAAKCSAVPCDCCCKEIRTDEIATELVNGNINYVFWQGIFDRCGVHSW